MVVEQATRGDGRCKNEPFSPSVIRLPELKLACWHGDSTVVVFNFEIGCLRSTESASGSVLMEEQRVLLLLSF